MKRIAILASGSGTNAENLVRYFTGHPTIEVATVICNRRQAGVYDRLRPLGIEVEHWGKEHWLDPTRLTEHLRGLGIDLVVLSGFLAVIREPLLTAYRDRIVNIHPSLLPRHGGPGMYGHHVHEQVLADGDRHSGITIHLVNEQVDGGRILAQFTCPVMPDDTPDTLAARIHPLEYVHFPPVIEDYLSQL
ncbi:MAG: phosphoribosylglycinamide formyltransferase [Muribaculaceae bacterium]|nr:phosphoribosylglycinamide formyltransferase [Muribaculaceae bacterium]MBR1726482.1 phosphoribosylglycinamide formyltransferase [Muribaculaceae bacterium]